MARSHRAVFPAATVVLGQTSFTNASANGNIATNLSPTVLTPPAKTASLWHPLGAVFLSSTNELFVVDSANNRVIVLPVQSGDTFGGATRVLGQDRHTSNSPNLIEGREFFSPAAAALRSAPPAACLTCTWPIPATIVCWGVLTPAR